MRRMAQFSMGKGMRELEMGTVRAAVKVGRRVSKRGSVRMHRRSFRKS